MPEGAKVSSNAEARRPSIGYHVRGLILVTVHPRPSTRPAPYARLAGRPPCAAGAHSMFSDPTRYGYFPHTLYDSGLRLHGCLNRRLHFFPTQIPRVQAIGGLRTRQVYRVLINSDKFTTMDCYDAARQSPRARSGKLNERSMQSVYSLPWTCAHVAGELSMQHFRTPIRATHSFIYAQDTLILIPAAFRVLHLPLIQWTAGQRS